MKPSKKAVATGITGSMNWDVNDADRQRGVVAYYANVLPCPACKAPTNLFWRVRSGVPARLACSMACATATFNGGPHG